MSNNTIRDYYSLINSIYGLKPHVVNRLGDNLQFLMTQNEIKLFLKQVDGNLIARSEYVGSKENKTDESKHLPTEFIVVEPEKQKNQIMLVY